MLRLWWYPHFADFIWNKYKNLIALYFRLVTVDDLIYEFLQ